MAKNANHPTKQTTRRSRPKPVTREYVHSLRGKYKGKGLLKAVMAIKEHELE